MNLSLYEQETIVNFNEEEKSAGIHTHNRALIRKLDKLAQGSAQVDGASATLSALLSEETTLTANQKAFEAERDGYTQAKQGYEGINTALAGARDTARQAAAAAAKQGVLDSVNALLAALRKNLK